MFAMDSKNKSQTKSQSENKSANKKNATNNTNTTQTPIKSLFSPLAAQLKPVIENNELTPIPKTNEAQENLRSKVNNTGIPTPMKNRFEALSGFSFDDVKVHYNSDKPAQLQALAYTQGNQVYVAPGQEKHLGHELGHVVQQKQGIVQAMRKINGQSINDNRQLEVEADNIVDMNILTFTGNTKEQMVESEDVIQRRLHPILSGTEDALEYNIYVEKWNAMIDGISVKHFVIEGVNDNILAQEEIIPEIYALNETSLPLEGKSDSVVSFNAKYTREYKWKKSFDEVKRATVALLEGMRIDRATANTLGWEAIIPFLRDELAPKGFLDFVFEINVTLAGGHGIGNKWEARLAGVAGEAIYFGAVPNVGNSHGRGDGALNGSRGMIRDVIDLHNAEIATYITTVEPLFVI